MRTQLRTTLEELRARDAVPPWVDPSAMATLIIAVVAGTVVNETVDPGHSAHRDVAAQFASLLVGASSGR